MNVIVISVDENRRIKQCALRYAGWRQLHEPTVFKTRAEFRAWLTENALSEEGVWLVFGKKGGPETLTANEALEEALCFGWIDGQMQSVDDYTYIKYFKQRSEKSNWSDKNKKLADKLEARGLMTDFGRAKIRAFAGMAGVDAGAAGG
jgi:uncharacterized protein YdeI (YjbR/CyaY-like superfamily)